MSARFYIFGIRIPRWLWVRIYGEPTIFGAGDADV